jgi:glycosyltransferase involved in cell wall biosynthesis
MLPVITVIIPCYNQAHYLPAAAESVIAQTFTNWECIIVNDGSQDDTEQVALALAEKDQRFKYIKKTNAGLSSARNTGLDVAKGEYIQFLDSDDLIDARKFIDSIEQAGDAAVVMTGFNTFVTRDCMVVPLFSLDQKVFNFFSILIGWDDVFVFPPHAGLFKSSLFKQLRFNEKLKAREDWLMWLQIYRQSPKTVFINRPYALYRTTPNSMSQNKMLMDKSLVDVYRVIFPMLNENEIAPFFNKTMNSLECLLADAAYQNMLLRKSESYRFGNFFINKLIRLKRLFPFK